MITVCENNCILSISKFALTRVVQHDVWCTFWFRLNNGLHNEQYVGCPWHIVHTLSCSLSSCQWGWFWKSNNMTIWIVGIFTADKGLCNFKSKLQIFRKVFCINQLMIDREPVLSSHFTLESVSEVSTDRCRRHSGFVLFSKGKIWGRGLSPEMLITAVRGGTIRHWEYTYKKNCKHSENKHVHVH